MPEPQQPSQTLHHLTTTTGHVSRTSRADVAHEVIAYLRPLVQQGIAPIRGPVPWWLHVHQSARGWASYTILPEDPTRHLRPTRERPLVHCVGCWRPEASATAWTHVLDRAGGEPPPVPWLAVTLASPLVLQRLGAEAVGMLGDLERCLFWTLAEAELDEPPPQPRP